MGKKNNKSSADDQAGPSKKSRKVDMRGEPAKRRKIEKKDKDIKKLTDLRDVLIKEYEEKFQQPYIPRVVEEADDDEVKQVDLPKIDSYTSYSDVYGKRDDHLKRITKAKQNGCSPCVICQDPLGNRNGNMCVACYRMKNRYELVRAGSTDDEDGQLDDEEGQDDDEGGQDDDEEGQGVATKKKKPLTKIKNCRGVKQLIGQCKPNWKLIDCAGDKLVKIKGQFPGYELKFPIPDATPPPCTQPGQYGHLMDLSLVNKSFYNFDLFPTELKGKFEGTGSLITRYMDFASSEKRVLCTTLYDYYQLVIIN